MKRLVRHHQHEIYDSSPKEGWVTSDRTFLMQTRSGNLIYNIEEHGALRSLKRNAKVRVIYPMWKSLGPEGDIYDATNPPSIIFTR